MNRSCCGSWTYMRVFYRRDKSTLSTDFESEVLNYETCSSPDSITGPWTQVAKVEHWQSVGPGSTSAVSADKADLQGREFPCSLRLWEPCIVWLEMLWLYNRACCVAEPLSTQCVWVSEVGHCRGLCVHIEDNKYLCGSFACMGDMCSNCMLTLGIDHLGREEARMLSCQPVRPYTDDGGLPHATRVSPWTFPHSQSLTGAHWPHTACTSGYPLKEQMLH